MRHPRWARREIATLDPVADHERLTHLLAEVRYGDAVLSSALYTVAFCRQMAVPSIARVVHRGGRSPIMRSTRERNDDTLVFFGELLRCGPSSAHGRATIARMGAIHAHFPIRNDQSLYTLASLAFEIERIPGLLGQRERFTEDELSANFHFWVAVGAEMGLADLPTSRSAFRDWTAAYEREHWAPSPGGTAVARAMVDDFVARWSGPRTRRAARELTLALMEDELVDAVGLKRPRARTRAAARALAGAYFTGRALLPDPGERSWSEAFGGRRAGPEGLATLGHLPERRA